MAPAEFRPFRGWRYDSANAGDLSELAAPPYDVISEADMTRLLQASDHNVIRLELPAATGAADPYRAASETWKLWTALGVLKRDESPRLYLVRHAFSHGDVTYSRFELVGLVRLAPWESGDVLPHEHTHEAAKRDRLSLMNALRANVSPIMSLYADDQGTVRRTLETIAARTPDMAFATPGGDEYEVWLVTDASDVEALRTAIGGPLYIADGHHRYETALTYQQQESQAKGNGSANYIMASLTALDDPGLISLPYHRLMRGLSEEARGRLERQVNTYFAVEEISIEGRPPEDVAGLFGAVPDSPDGQPIMAMIERPGDTLKLMRPVSPGIFEGLLSGESEAWGRLAPCVFTDVLLSPALGVGQQEAESRGLVTYPRNTAEAVAGVRSGEYESAFLLQPVSMADMTEAARAGERLPPKSTYFFPKLATGIVINSLAESVEAE